MTVAPICIIQARLNSTRFPGKMLATLGGETLIARGHRLACEAFGAEHVVVAIPASDAAGPLGEELRRIGATVFPWGGPEADVLTRFYSCAHTYRWRPESVIVRWTADDPFKDPEACRRVAAGERLPVEIGAEAFTLAMLDEAHRTQHAAEMREHLTCALFELAPPPAPAGRVWTIDFEADLVAAEAEHEWGAARQEFAEVAAVHSAQLCDQKASRRRNRK